MFNVVRALDRNAQRWPDAEAVVCGNRRLSHAALARRVHALAAGLQELGVGRGDVVAILLHNSIEFLEATFGINKIGAIFLPLNTRLAPDEWRYIIEHAGAIAVATEPSFTSVLDQLRPMLPSIRHVVVIRGGDTVNGSGPLASPGDALNPRDGAIDYDDLLRRHDGSVVPTTNAAETDLQRLMYTSGTTARPKGVPLTYGNVLWKTIGHVVEFGITAADCTLIAGPMYHVGGFDLPGTGVLYVGGSLVILQKFNARDVMLAIEDERPTNLWLAPSMVNAILALDDLDSFDTTSVRFITNGGEKMPVPLVQRLLHAFPAAWLADSYGLTETVSGDTFLDSDHVLSKLGSVGRPVLHLDVRVVDERGQEVSPGTSGEIVLRGPKVFHGYWRDPDATAKAILDGWFHTGDVGYVDADGYLFIEDRKKDMIVSGGENVATPEVERVLYEHESVLEAAVVGVPDERWAEVPLAVVVLRPGVRTTAEELTEHCTGRLAKFKVPKEIRFVEELPRGPSGKVLKRELRNQFGGRAGA
ncbi:MAG: long-chain fatty acid--CoA ligase [Actinomycetota bacterium]|nr:long-chain fatty acid--CoA ligase [Actinomycetota bacterium]